MAQELTGAEIFVRCLKDEGVEYVFGYPGGAALHIYDALYKQEDVKHILVRHEQGATHAADGYARSTGRPGVVLVTSGPGVTNTVTGIATAYMDSIPLVVFSGQVATSLIGNDAFQEVDAVGITRPCVKHNILVKDVRDLATAIRKAFIIATTGRPGPVLVDIPKDVTAHKCEYEYPKEVVMRSYKPVSKGHPGQIKKAVDLLLEAKRPMIYTGGGIILGEASKSLTEFVRLLGYPITQTLMGLGAFPASDPLNVGMLGMHGTYEANMAMHECDVLLAVGARFDDRVTGDVKKFCPHAEIIHIDIDPTSIKKNVHAHIPIVGDVKTVLRELNLLLLSMNGNQSELEEERRPWREQIEEWKRAHPLRYAQDDRVIKPQHVIEKLYELTNHEGIIATDVGQHQMWAAQYFKGLKPRTFITSGGLGTMGFGFPAALGAQKAYPEKLVVCITSEGSFQMNLQELATAVVYNLPVKIVLINNQFHGMVRQWQDLFYEGRYSCSYLGKIPDFTKLAEAYGILGLRAEKPAEVEPVLREGLKHKGPVMMDFHVDPYENCYPMIPAGGAHHEMIVEDPPELRKLGPAKKKADEGQGVLPA